MEKKPAPPREIIVVNIRQPIGDSTKLQQEWQDSSSGLVARQEDNLCWYTLLQPVHTDQSK